MSYTDFASSDLTKDTKTLPPEVDQPDSDEGDTDDTEKKQVDLAAWAKSHNIADEIDDEELAEIGARVVSEFNIDDASREDWEKNTKAAMDLAMQVAKSKSFPWPNASNVIFPLMTSASIQFAARAYPAIVAGRNVVKGVVTGPDDGEPKFNPQTGQPLMNQEGAPIWAVPPGAKKERAQRIGEHMSYQLLCEMKEWETETDQLLHILPIAGCVFRKSYFDKSKGRNCSHIVLPMNLYINYGAKSLETVPRITEVVRFYPREIEEMERSGLFRDIEYSPPATGGSDDRDEPHEFLEQHRYWDLDDDGYSEPYVITVHKDTSQVVRVRARFESDKIMKGQDGKITSIEPVHYYTKYGFLPNPDGGIYDVGFGQLLRPINEAVNTALNQMFDAGTLANTGGGFIGRNLSMHSGMVRFAPGEYKVVNAAGSAVRDSIVPLQFPGPSMVLFQLLGLLIEAGREIAAVKDVLTGSQDQHNVPATTTLALIEQGLKTFTAIFKRVHRSLKSELEKLYDLNRIYLPEYTYFEGEDEQWQQIARQDYVQGSGVKPISDETMVSDMQKLAHAQFLMSFNGDPLMNQLEIRKRVLDATRTERPQELLVTQQPPPPPDVVAKGLELEIKAKREQAAELKDLAQAILFFAQADKAVGDQHLAWVTQSLEGWRAQFEAHNAANAEGGSGQTPDSPPPMPVGGPGLGGVSSSPIGQPPGGMDPAMMRGARRAPDGNWYIPDPHRPGKYLMVSSH